MSVKAQGQGHGLYMRKTEDEGEDEGTAPNGVLQVLF